MPVELDGFSGGTFGIHWDSSTRGVNDGVVVAVLGMILRVRWLWFLSRLIVAFQAVPRFSNARSPDLICRIYSVVWCCSGTSWLGNFQPLLNQALVCLNHHFIGVLNRRRCWCGETVFCRRTESSVDVKQGTRCGGFENAAGRRLELRIGEVVFEGFRNNGN